MRRSHRVIAWTAISSCVALIGACGNDGDAGASGDRLTTVTTPTSDGNAGTATTTPRSGASRGEDDCSLVDISTVEGLFSMDLHADVGEGVPGSGLCNLVDAEDLYSVLISRIAVDGEHRYDEAVATLADPVAVDVGDEALARASQDDFGGSVDLHARRGDVYVTVSVTFPPDRTADAMLNASAQLAERVF